MVSTGRTNIDIDDDVIAKVQATDLDELRAGTPPPVIVVDTSAWVEFVRGTGSPAGVELGRALSRDENIGVVDVVRMEMLAGADSDEQVATVTRLLARGVPLPALSPATTRTRRCSTVPHGGRARPIAR